MFTNTSFSIPSKSNWIHHRESWVFTLHMSLGRSRKAWSGLRPQEEREGDQLPCTGGAGWAFSFQTRPRARQVGRRLHSISAMRLLTWVPISPETLSGTRGAQQQTCQWCRLWRLCCSPYFCGCFSKESQWFLINLPWMQHRLLTGFCPEPKIQIILLWKNRIIITTKITALSLKADLRILDLTQKLKDYQVYFHVVIWLFCIWESLRGKSVVKSRRRK